MKDDLLAQLQRAASDEEREWLVFERSMGVLGEELQAAIWAAAIPHWIDHSFLGALLRLPELEFVVNASNVIVAKEPPSSPPLPTIVWSFAAVEPLNQLEMVQSPVPKSKLVGLPRST